MIASDVRKLLLILGGIGLFVAVCYQLMDTVNNNGRINKNVKWVCGVPASMVLLGVLTPSTQTLALMLSVEKIANSAFVKQDAPELYELGVKVLKQKLAEELKEKKAD
jgi:hypothetical protein